MTAFTAALMETIAEAGRDSHAERLSIDDVVDGTKQKLAALGLPQPEHYSIPGQRAPSEDPGGTVRPIFPNLFCQPTLSPTAILEELYARIIETDKKSRARTNETRARLETETTETRAQLEREAARIGRRGRVRAVIVTLVSLAVTAGSIGLLVTWWRRTQDIVATVNPALGWQRVATVRKGELSCLRADGRTNLGLNQVVNMMNIAKPLVVKYAPPDSKLKAIDYPWKKDYDRAIFRRPWNDPDGAEMPPDDMLEEARIRPDCRWGKLLLTLLPESSTLLASSDPFRVLSESNVALKDVICIGARYEFTAPENGVLAVIVNDAVASPVFPKDRSRSNELFLALSEASKHLEGGQRISEESIPLFWFSDNGGALSVRVRAGRCP